MKSIIKNIALGSFVLFAAGFMASCGDDELNSAELKVYVRFDDASTMATYSISHTPVATVLEGNAAKFPAKSSRELAADATVNFKVDESLIEAYNEANGTNYQPMPSAAYSLAHGGKLTIKQGQMASLDSMEVVFAADLSSYKDLKGYLVPVTISSIETSDKGLEMATLYHTIYIVLKVGVINVKPATVSTLAGTVVGGSGKSWVCNSTINNGGAFTSRPLVIDGNYANGSYYITGMNVNTYFVFDFGSPMAIKGVKMYTYNYSASLNMTPTGFEVSSADVLNGVSTSWNDMGPCTNAIKGSYVTPVPNGEVPFFIEFYSPVTTRYLKIRHTGSNYGGYWGTREIEFVQ